MKMTTEPHDHQGCVEMFERLSEYLDNELDALTCEDIEKHAAECISCRVCLETLKRTIDLCRHLDAPCVPKDFSRRLQQALSHRSV